MFNLGISRTRDIWFRDDCLGKESHKHGMNLIWTHDLEVCSAECHFVVMQYILPLIAHVQACLVNGPKCRPIFQILRYASNYFGLCVHYWQLRWYTSQNIESYTKQYRSKLLEDCKWTRPHILKMETIIRKAELIFDYQSIHNSSNNNNNNNNTTTVYTCV